MKFYTYANRTRVWCFGRFHINLSPVHGLSFMWAGKDYELIRWRKQATIFAKRKGYIRIWRLKMGLNKQSAYKEIYFWFGGWNCQENDKNEPTIKSQKHTQDNMLFAKKLKTYLIKEHGIELSIDQENKVTGFYEKCSDMKLIKKANQ